MSYFNNNNVIPFKKPVQTQDFYRYNVMPPDVIIRLAMKDTRDDQEERFTTWYKEMLG